MARATGLAESTVRLGQQALTRPAQATAAPRRLRRSGAGRKPLTTQDHRLLKALDACVEPTTRGAPMSPLRWTCQSTGRHLLTALHDSLQGPRNTREGASPPDRNAPFEYIKAQVHAFQQRGPPVVSVDTKNKAWGGDFANGGRESHPQGAPEQVRVHDFLDQRVGKARPDGVYDMTHNWGWGSVGVDHDTAEWAGASVPPWWQRLGQRMAPHAQQVLMTAEGGGRNGRRSRLRKVARQMLRDTTGLEVSVCHFPPGTSQWHKIEPRLFCHRTENWRGRPLVSHEVIVHLIAKTTTEAGLRVGAALDPAPYDTGTKVSDDELAQVHIDPADFHGTAWNSVIKPRNKKR